MTITKKEAAAQARARGENKFTADCKHHGETAHYVSGTACVLCLTAAVARAPSQQATAKRATKAKRLENPEARAAHNAAKRKHNTTSKRHRAYMREYTAAAKWTERTEGKLTGIHELEREALRNLYGSLPEEFDGEHMVPKVAYGLIDGERKHVATGMHSFANIVPTPRKVNNWKGSQFAPDTNRLQRPANRHPGGAFDPRPTAHEIKLIANAEYEGTPASASLEALRGSLDTQARAYEAHVEAVEADLSVRYTNALALMLGYAGALVHQHVLALAA